MDMDRNDFFKANFSKKFKSAIDIRYSDLPERKRNSAFKNDFCNKSNIDRISFESTFSSWMYKGKTPTLPNLVIICDILHCDFNYFFTSQQLLNVNAFTAAETTGLSETTINELSDLSTAEKHIVDVMFSRSASGTKFVKTIKEMLFYSHPNTENKTHIVLDKDLTRRDKDYEYLEKQLCESEVYDILSYKLGIEMKTIIDDLSKDEKLSDEIHEDYKSKFFKKHMRLRGADELPQLGDSYDTPIEDKIEKMENKIFNRLEKRDEQGKRFDYGIENLYTCSDFSHIVQELRYEKTEEEYLIWLNEVDMKTE